MRLIYLTVATIPNKTAHSKYVMKLCESFKNNGKDVSIVSGKIKNINEKIEFKSYRLRIKEGKYKSLILLLLINRANIAAINNTNPLAASSLKNHLKGCDK